MVEADAVVGDQLDPVTARDDVGVDPVRDGRAEHVEHVHRPGQLLLPERPIGFVEDDLEAFLQRPLHLLGPAPGDEDLEPVHVRLSPCLR